MGEKVAIGIIFAVVGSLVGFAISLLIRVILLFFRIDLSSDGGLWLLGMCQIIGWLFMGSVLYLYYDGEEGTERIARHGLEGG
jgi:hypothetical protein